MSSDAIQRRVHILGRPSTSPPNAKPAERALAAFDNRGTEHYLGIDG
jgi:hypothetical protein